MGRLEGSMACPAAANGSTAAPKATTYALTPYMPLLYDALACAVQAEAVVHLSASPRPSRIVPPLSGRRAKENYLVVREENQ